MAVRKPSFSPAFLLLLLLLCSHAQAQQEGLFNVHSSNWQLRHPASTGWEDYIEARSAYRRQWLGSPNGPDAYYLNVHAPLNYYESRTNALPMLSKSTLQNKQAPPSKDTPWYRHGLGFTALVQNNRPLRMNLVQASYAIHFKLSKEARASVGANVGIRQWRVNADDLNLEQSGDWAFEEGFISEIVPSVGVGIAIYHPKYFLMASASQVLEEPLSLNGEGNGNTGILATHYYGSLGYRFILGNNWELNPMAMLRYLEPSGWVNDWGLKVSYQDKYWGGVSYRQGSGAIGGNIGALLLPWMQLSYTFESTNAQSSELGRSNHEVALGLRLPVRQYGLTQRYF